MIITERVKINPRNKSKYWSSLGYDTSNSEIEVSVHHLMKNSNVSVLCQCDECSGKFFQRYSRRTDICSSCRISNRMKGNTNGNKNKKVVNYNKEELRKLVSRGLGKQEIANELGVTLSILTRLLKENDLVVEKYRGLKKYTDEEKNSIIKDINQKHQTKTIGELVGLTGVSRSVLSRWKKEGLISNKTWFDRENERYENVLENMEQYVELNKTKTLKVISEEEEVSVEHLKKAFSETGNKVILHSYNKSKGELEIKSFIQSLNVKCFSYMFDKTYEIDCYAPEYKFGVEYCGEYWHRYQPKKNNKKYHVNKFNFCKDMGVSLFTIFECEWENKQEIIKSMISARLGFAEKIYARNCIVSKISSEEARTFHEENHINGYCPSSKNFGLLYQGKLVSVLSFSKSRFDKSCEYEITRFSSLRNTVVVGGLSKLFKNFVTSESPESCMTYADLRFGEGKSYEKIGFDYHSRTAPNYFYFKKGGYRLENRMNYQKEMLRKFPNFSLNKSELQIMEENDYYRLYDCGNNKYVWTKKGT